MVPAAVLERDALLCRLAFVRQGLVLPLSQAAFSLASQCAWLACGYRTADDFCREALERTGRWLRDLVRLHAAVERLPALRAAVAESLRPVSQMAALAIARVATDSDVGSWIDRARRLGLGRLRQEVRQALEERGQEASDTPEEEPHEEPRVVWRLEVPPEVALAHEAVRELQRAFAGRETGPGGFAEAVSGEVSGRGLEYPGDFRPRFVRLDAGPGRWQGPGWSAAPSRSGELVPGASVHWTSARGTPGMREAQRVLAEFERQDDRLARLVRGLGRASAAKATTGRIRRLLAVLRRLVRLQNRLEIAVGELLLEQHSAGRWDLLGYGGLEAYAEERLGLGRTAAWGRVRLARQLRRYAPVREAYVAGRLGQEKAQVVVRVLRDRPGASVDAWVEAASRTTVRRLRQEERLLRCEVLQGRCALARSLTRGRGAGVGACDAPAGEGACVGHSPAGPRHEPVDDATWRASLRRVPGETQVWLFGLGLGLAERVARDGPLLAVRLDLVLPEDLAADLARWVEAARRALASQPVRTAAEECRLWPAARLANSFVCRGLRVPEWVGYLALLETCAVAWDAPEPMPERDPVVERDGCHCLAPGCTARADLHRHHLVYRSDGGGNEASNQILLCLVHHKLGEHGGQARCRGRAPLDVVWRLGCAALGTWWRNDKRLERPP